MSAVSMLLESLTSRYARVRVTLGLICHWVGVELLRRNRRFPAAPCRVSALVIVVVLPAAKVRVSAVVTVLVRLKNVVSPVMDWRVPLSVTVLDVWVNVPLSLVQFPATFRAGSVPVNANVVPEPIVKFPLTVVAPFRVLVPAPEVVKLYQVTDPGMV